ncbi:MAG: hypothetical protein WD342_04785 [Verrucomicrobiales bacterium]
MASPNRYANALGGTDFFGTLIHEVGHTLGLAHSTLAATGPDARPGRGKFSSSQPGPNGKFDLDEGSDGIRGSSDDRRLDDVNAVYFKKADNDPFSLPEDDTIDSTTYSRELEDLPSGHLSPAIPTREAAEALHSRPATEAMMVGGGSLVPAWVRRGLGADDIATHPRARPFRRTAGRRPGTGGVGRGVPDEPRSAIDVLSPIRSSSRQPGSVPQSTLFARRSVAYQRSRVSPRVNQTPTPTRMTPVATRANF